MIDMDQLETDLQTVLEPIVIGIEPTAFLIIEPNNDPVPADSYATMKLSAMEKTGFSIVSEVLPNDMVRVRAEYDISWTFSSFGLRAKNINANLHFAVTDDLNVAEQLELIGLFQFNAPIISDLPLFVSSQTWEDRSRATVQFHYAYEQEIDVGYIETLTIAGTLLNPDDSIALLTNTTLTL
jgi:hypothetical protein